MTAPPDAAHAIAERVRTIVPELVGLSLGVVEDRVTLTLVASSDTLAGLDAVQYVDGGPCVAGMERGEPFEVTMEALLDEERWQLYARASTAVGVESSLSLPIMDGDRVVGGVNLYASGPVAFTGLHEEVAEAIGEDAALAVTDADLSLPSARQAMEAPARVRGGSETNVALGILSAAQDVNIPIARERLRKAAARAGITEAEAARAIIRVRQG